MNPYNSFLTSESHRSLRCHPESVYILFDKSLGWRYTQHRVRRASCPLPFPVVLPFPPKHAFTAVWVSDSATGRPFPGAELQERRTLFLKLGSVCAPVEPMWHFRERNNLHCLRRSVYKFLGEPSLPHVPRGRGQNSNIFNGLRKKMGRKWKKVDREWKKWVI